MSKAKITKSAATVSRGKGKAKKTLEKAMCHSEVATMMKVTEARANLQHIIDSVHYTKEALIITKHGKPWVAIGPLPEEDPEIMKLLN